MQQQPPAPYQYPMQQQPVTRTDPYAIWSLILGILWMFWVGSILAIIFGHMALRRMSRLNTDGKGLAITGLVFGYLSFVPAVFLFISLIVGLATSSQPG